jgi:flagellar secretion chaperone FliS
MAQSQQSQYLETKILTAPSHRLHLMLLEGALRFGKEAEAALRRGDPLAADAPSMRLLDILGELLVGVRQTKTKLNQQIADVYLHIFRLAGGAKVNDDPDKLNEALRLLEFERQTWQLACEKIAGEQPAAAAPKLAPLAPSIAALPPTLRGISLQA